VITVTDPHRRRRIVLSVAALLALGGCGQTGPLMLPGSAPVSSEPTTSAEDESEAANDDETDDEARR
jgi:predicted small lipoprotein YifL